MIGCCCRVGKRPSWRSPLSPEAARFPNGQLRVGFEGERAVEAPLPLVKNQKAVKTLVSWPRRETFSAIAACFMSLSRRMASELWKKDIRTMVVAQRPAVARLRRRRNQAALRRHNLGPGPQDQKILAPSTTTKAGIRSSTTSSSSSPTAPASSSGAAPATSPSGPGLYNTGLTYQWAETIPPHGFVDCVEPLQDKELRFGRVRIIESTPARVHVRWTYESVDVDYRRLGDQAYEDFYFYPDGFGTRVLTLTSSPNADYEITEFITILPQSAYPFEVLPKRLIDILYLDGQKRGIDFPYQPPKSEKDLGILTQAHDPSPAAEALSLLLRKARQSHCHLLQPQRYPRRAAGLQALLRSRPDRHARLLG